MSSDRYPTTPERAESRPSESLGAADTLREAARLMRERAEAAEHFTSPWGVYPDANGCLIGYATDNPDAGLVATTADYVPLGAAEHIASWHPSVALVVADWLDDTAKHSEVLYDETGVFALAVAGALDVARAYLGAKESSPTSHAEMQHPTSLGQRVAMENTLQARRGWRQPTEPTPGGCGDPACYVLHRDPAHPIHPHERPHRHLITRHTHPEWHGHCDPDVPGYKPCDQPHWHFWWRHAHA